MNRNRRPSLRGLGAILHVGHLVPEMDRPMSEGPTRYDDPDPEARTPVFRIRGTIRGEAPPIYSPWVSCQLPSGVFSST